MLEEFEEWYKKEIRVLNDSDNKIANKIVFRDFLNSNKQGQITQVEIQVESGSLGIYEALKEGAKIAFGSPTEFNKVGDRVKEYLKQTNKKTNKKTLPTIYVSEKPSNVIEVAEKNPEVISFLFSTEMNDGYNIQAINLAISAVNNLNDGDFERNRKLLIDAAKEYQELSKAIEDINKRGEIDKKISIGDYVEQKLGEDRDWLKTVQEQLWLSSPLHEHSSDKGGSPKLEFEPKRLFHDEGSPSSDLEPSVPPLPNSSENFVSYDETKKIINFKVKSDNANIENKFHYNKKPSEKDKNFPLADTAESNNYLSENYTIEKEQGDILKLLQKASEETIKVFEGAKLDDNFFIAVMKVASENCGIASIKQEEDFNNALVKVIPNLEIKKYNLTEGSLHKIAKYFSAQFQKLSEEHGYLTAREGKDNKVNTTPRRLFRVCTDENIKAFKVMQAQEAVKKLAAQPLARESVHQSPRSSPSSPESSHKTDKEASSGPSTMASI